MADQLYLVTAEPRRKRTRTLTRLYRRLVALDNAQLIVEFHRLGDATWLVRMQGDVDALHTYMLPEIDDDRDVLFIAPVGGHCAGNIDTALWPWIVDRTKHQSVVNRIEGKPQ